MELGNLTTTLSELGPQWNDKKTNGLLEKILIRRTMVKKKQKKIKKKKSKKRKRVGKLSS